MMTRIISGTIAALFALAVILFGGVIGLVIAVALIGSLAVFELLRAAGFSTRDRIPAAAAALAAPLLLLVSGQLLWVLFAVYMLYPFGTKYIKHAVEKAREKLTAKK